MPSRRALLYMPGDDQKKSTEALSWAFNKNIDKELQSCKIQSTPPEIASPGRRPPSRRAVP